MLTKSLLITKILRKRPGELWRDLLQPGADNVLVPNSVLYLLILGRLNSFIKFFALYNACLLRSFSEDVKKVFLNSLSDFKK